MVGTRGKNDKANPSKVGVPRVTTQVGSHPRPPRGPSLSHCRSLKECPRDGRPGNIQSGHDGVLEDGTRGLLEESAVTQGGPGGGQGCCRSHLAYAWSGPQRGGRMVTGSQACGPDRPWTEPP
jgi:hypothetical protein